MHGKLTPAFVTRAAVAPGAMRTTYWDAGMPGFGPLTKLCALGEGPPVYEWWGRFPLYRRQLRNSSACQARC
jgi:hypothetical protein